MRLQPCHHDGGRGGENATQCKNLTPDNLEFSQVLLNTPIALGQPGKKMSANIFFVKHCHYSSGPIAATMKSQDTCFTFVLYMYYKLKALRKTMLICKKRYLKSTNSDVVVKYPIYVATYK